MINGIKDKIFSIQSCIGIEVKIESDGNYFFNFVVLEKQKENIIVKESGSNYNSLDQLIPLLPKAKAICLTFTGRGILYKKLNDLNSKDPSKIIQAALPSANLNDFYMQYYLYDNHCLAQITKVNLIDPLLKSFQTEGFSIIHVSFGGLPLINLIPILTNLDSEATISLGEFELDIIEGKTENIKHIPQKTDVNVSIGEEILPISKVSAYAAALQTFLPNQLLTNIKELPFWKQEFIHKQLYSKLLVGILVSFLIALLINFVVYNYYADENNQFQSEKNTNQKILQLATELEKKLEEKEQFLKSSGWLNPSKISYYSDRIASTVPITITLSELSINPTNKRKLKEQKIIEFSESLIILSGNCKRSVDLNEWIKNMSALDFVSQVDVKNYSHDEYENLGKFEIEILTK